MNALVQTPCRVGRARVDAARFRGPICQPDNSARHRAVPAIGFGAMPVQGERVVLKLESTCPGDFHLTFLDIGIDEFLDATTLQAYQVVVMLALVELEERATRLEIAALENTRLFELGEHAIHGGQPDVVLEFQKLAKNIFGAHVPVPTLLEDFQNLHAGRSGLETGAAQFGGLLHGELAIERAKTLTLCIIKGYPFGPSPRLLPDSAHSTKPIRL